MRFRTAFIGAAVVATSFGMAAIVVPADASTHVGAFIVRCGFDHSAPDDPIVHPNRAFASHVHSFFGLRGVTSNPKSLLGASTRCGALGDHSSYWAPALLVNGKPVVPDELRAYYFGTGLSQRPPAHFRVVAGNAMSLKQQSMTVAYWGCGSGSKLSKVTYVPQCKSSEDLTLHVKFPDCWDGKIPADGNFTRDVASDGQTHGDGKCPKGFPHHLIALTMAISWPVHPKPSSVSLTSMGQNSAHADYASEWAPGFLESLDQRCIAKGKDCKVVGG